MADYLQFATAFPWFFPALAFGFGACIGSFLNVVIYRVPAGKSIVTPGSHCACGAPIAWYDNLPILSWFLLRGRARCCGRRYSFRYAFVELLTAGLFLACWLLFPPGSRPPDHSRRVHHRRGRRRRGAFLFRPGAARPA
jgi:leader peptidase (prepilin peptidase)/N-methyltransferase